MMAAPAISKPASGTTNWAIGVGFLVAYLALYSATLYSMVRFAGFEAEEALGVFAVLGVAFSLGAWALTVGVTPLSCPVREPRSELATIGLYLIPLVAFVTWGFAAIHHSITTEPAASLILLLAKLIVFVAFPGWLLCVRFGYKLRDLAPLSSKTSHMLVVVAMAFAMLVFQAVAGRGWQNLSAANVSGDKLLWGVPLVFLWLVLEVGVVEEFYFRALLQSRLSVVLRSELAGIVVMAVVFGLVHAPGLYLRTAATQEGLSAHPSLLMAIGYSLVITSTAGFFLGVLWARTRNFLVVVLVHAAADLLPNLLPTMQAFHFVK